MFALCFILFVVALVLFKIKIEIRREGEFLNEENLKRIK